MIVIVLSLFIMVTFVVGMLFAFTDVFETDSKSSSIQDNDSENITLPKQSSEHTSVKPKQTNNIAKNVTCTVSKGSCPSISCPPGMECGCYTTSGLGNNKKAYKDAGADRGFLASAMMETEKMDANYAYGDNKTHDSFNAGATKQNWGMMRQCHPEWTTKTPNEYSISNVMNNDRSKDVIVYNECKKMFGDKWFAGHRNGASGLINPNTKDIQMFKQGYDWTYKQLEGHECDDVRFWVNIPAI